MEEYKVAIGNVSKKKSSNTGNHFLIVDVNIANSDKQNEGIFVWDEIEQNYELLEKGMTGVMKVDGMNKDYTKMLEFEENRDLDPSIFVTTALNSSKKAEEIFNYMLEEINKNDSMKALNDKLWTDELIDKFLWCPGAQGHHHAKAQGLILHIYEMFRYVERITEDSYFDIDRSVLLEAVLLHDLGKVKDYKVDEYGSVSTTKESKWNSHLHTAASKVENAVDMDIECYQHLVHCILSHHKNLDWGSIKEPKTMEAILLHQADNFSAQYNKYHNEDFDEEGIGQTSKFVSFGSDYSGN